MGKKGGKPSFPLHKVLGSHISRVRASKVYTEPEKKGVLRFVSYLLAGVDEPDVLIKPVTIPGYAALIGSDYVLFASDLGRPNNDDRTAAVKKELVRQGRVAAKKRAAAKKAKRPVQSRTADNPNSGGNDRPRGEPRLCGKVNGGNDHDH